MWELIANAVVIAYLLFLAFLVFVDIYAGERKIANLERQRAELELRLKEQQQRYIQFVLGIDALDQEELLAERLNDV